MESDFPCRSIHTVTRGVGRPKANNGRQSSDRSFGFFDHTLQGGYLPKEFHSRLCGTAEQHCTGGYIGNHPCRGTDLGTLTDVWTGRSGRSRCGQQRMFSETRSAQGDMLIRSIIARIRHAGYGTAAGRGRWSLLTGIEGASSGGGIFGSDVCAAR
jgi:hypothetical protein